MKYYKGAPTNQKKNHVAGSFKNDSKNKKGEGNKAKGKEKLTDHVTKRLRNLSRGMFKTRQGDAMHAQPNGWCMPDYYGIGRADMRKKGPSTYKPAKGGDGKASHSGQHTKPATNKRINMVDKKVKRVSNKIIRYHSKTPGPAAKDRY